jgi:D-alanyl-D-alanine carboxypeptidase
MEAVCGRNAVASSRLMQNLLDGVSPLNPIAYLSVACTRLLGFMYISNARDARIAMLPVGGEDGALARRLGGAAEARSIHAKTGTLNRAIALSGYAESKTCGWLAFSILVNDFAAPQSEIQAWIDKIALALAQ